MNEPSTFEARNNLRHRRSFDPKALASLGRSDVLVTLNYAQKRVFATRDSKPRLYVIHEGSCTFGSLGESEEKVLFISRLFVHTII